MTTTTATLEDLLRPERVRDNLGAWRWSVRRRLVPVRDRLLREHPVRGEAWLSARATRTLRERDALIARLSALAAELLVSEEVDVVADRLSRLLADIVRHQQRVDDLAWDDVELEIGGSE
jgi:hypothetical protein